MAIFNDDFNRADNTDLGANWDSGYTGYNNAQIVGNEVRATVLDTISMESVNAISAADAQYAQVTIRTSAGTTFIGTGVSVRMAAPATDTRYGLEAQRNNGSVTTDLYKIVAGSFTDFANENGSAWTSGETLKLVADKTRIQAFRGSKMLFQVDDSSISSGRVGIEVLVAAPGNLADSEIDDFQGGDATGAVDNARCSAFPKQKIAEDFTRRNHSRGFDA